MRRGLKYFEAPPKALVKLPSIIAIRVRIRESNGIDPASELRTLFERKPGNAQVRLKLEKPYDFIAMMDVPFRVRPDKEFKAEIERICGGDDFEVLEKA